MFLSWVTGKDSRQRGELSVSGQMGERSERGWQTDVLGSSACRGCGRVGVGDGEAGGKETSSLHVRRFWSAVDSMHDV